MNISLIWIGSTSEKYLTEGIKLYIDRLKHYTQFDIIEIPYLKNSKNLSEQVIKDKEGELILSKISSSDMLILLDENGKEMSSIGFSLFIAKLNLASVRNLYFIIGGAYGFSNDVYKRANHKLSLSQMTYSHQMVRLIFSEQLYRAHTILKGEPYHHR